MIRTLTNLGLGTDDKEADGGISSAKAKTGLAGSLTAQRQTPYLLETGMFMVDACVILCWLHQQ